MKFYSLLISALLILFVACTPEKKMLTLYVGTYSVENSEGIYAYSFDPENGDLRYQSVTSNRENPSFICLSPDRKKLYAVGETDNFENQDSGSVTAYKIEKDGTLSRLNQLATQGNHPCHVCLSPDGATLVASNYTSGSISIYSVNRDGSLAEMSQLIQHEGSGPDTIRQQGPHAHSSQFSADGRLLMTADLGLDKLFFYRSLPDSMTYVPASPASVQMEPGAGPRHFAYTRDMQYIYVMNEMASTVSVLKKGDEGYELVSSVSSLPADFEGTKAGADIHLSGDERFVYCSNRGQNTLSVFARNTDDGSLSIIQNEPVQGNWPRNFVLSPDGKFVLVANQYSNNIAVFARDEQSGRLTFTGKNYQIPSPVCLKFREQ
ncbi:lactonase family protein [Mangrovibacterium marinum]|uniref:6-phosphogluconolactonase n=1 Tax=Mangrovibacterium marinum TaxID=1639118 RepID=A0A2T5C4G0_9BACT|nr:lactonase family protein [Mangrovibacterium marinum]PTN09729.1 6-phosphogluconolactonase [Mangrovibacterium marinum]